MSPTKGKEAKKRAAANWKKLTTTSSSSSSSPPVTLILTITAKLISQNSRIDQTNSASHLPSFVASWRKSVVERPLMKQGEQTKKRIKGE
jgi:hypothetical protein